MLSLLGVPAAWAASLAIPGFIIGIAFGWIDPIVGGLTALVLIGFTIVISRSGAGL